uniref:SAM domain-containing protein n=5 Tax=Homalodisca TaxID=139475 RepID=A0A1B6HPP3_9HEMI
MITADEPPLKKQALEGSKSDQDKCEACGKTDIKLKLKKGRRFCSVSCKRKLSKSGSPDKRGGLEAMDLDNNDSAVSGAESSSPSPPDAATADTEDSSASDTTPKVNPLKWTVSDVCEFIRALPGCTDYAEDFAIQEIDGQALMLLKEDHLMSAMAMKLGPALKICAKIDTMRGTPQPQPSPEK